ncbi:B-cell differentiation antigen CD72 [Varanus komodoensis]|uniref:B-cell differentiation antigen CD72 n=1 Tax=Varanus komodoensis TaxID=61221 RepID=UPI001CF7E3B4|nr:B-cell differentiation antigen CD72 [Varanus komodoensis]
MPEGVGSCCRAAQPSPAVLFLHGARLAAMQEARAFCLGSPICPGALPREAPASPTASFPCLALASFRLCLSAIHLRMSQDVTYADLRFAGAPREGRCRARREGSVRSRRPPQCPGETVRCSRLIARLLFPMAGGVELSYDNFLMASSPLGKAPPSGPKGPNRLSWLVVLGLASAALLLLATAAGLGLLYQQVSQQLRETPPACAAGNGTLARRRADAEPEPEPEGDAEGDGALRLRLRRTQEALAAQQKATRELEEALNATRAQPCSAWCPEQWVLLRRKCLFFARERKTWEESKRACEEVAARLLITQSWEPVELPGALQTVEFWIGLKELHLGGPRTRTRTHTWTWVDGTHAEGAEIEYVMQTTSLLCVVLKQGNLSGNPCSFLFPYICEKAASAPTSGGH